MRRPRSIACLITTGALSCLCVLCGWSSGVSLGDESESARVDFSREIKPLLEERCVRCHGAGEERGGFRLDTRELFLEGGDDGPAAIPGKSGESLVVKLVRGENPDRVMPAKGRRLTAAEVALLAAWIDQGLEWEAGFRFEAKEKADVSPRRPELPAPRSAWAPEHPVDRILDAYFTANGVRPGEPIPDRRFARRVFLDVIGLLPTQEEIEAFVADEHPDKRGALVRGLLARRTEYAEHWLTFWNDALRNDYRGTGYIDGGRKQITDWLYGALYRGMPYDQFVRELISPEDGSEGFIKGIVWRGVVNASQVPAMQAAQNVSQVFMGVNLKCASCHDSFINEWKLDEAYALANIFSAEPLEIHRCNKPTGQVAGSGFIFPALGSVDADAPRDERLRQLADLVASERNGRLTRTIVNRLWAMFFGRGIVEPLDEMDGPAWSRDVLDWLASDLADHGYDLDHTIELLLTSRCYQLAAVPATEALETDFVFRGPIVRRMSAEQFVDAVGSLTGLAQPVPAEYVPRVVSLAPAEDTKHTEHITEHAAHGHDFVRFSSGVVTDGEVAVDVDIGGAETLWLIVTEGEKGKHYDWANWGEPRLVGPDGSRRLTELSWKRATSGHKEPLVDRNVTGGPLRLSGAEVPYGIGTHSYSVIVYDLPPGFTRFQARVGPDSAATEASREGHEIEFLVLTDVRVRASLTNADALTRALGRPNREQVVTRRASAATTLQALELTNGETLDQAIRRGAESWLSRSDRTASEIVEEVYLRAFGRRPTPAERSTAEELVGRPPAPEGLEDLLWVVAMLPEFQSIY